MAAAFTAFDLKSVPRKKLQDAASTIELANYGSKKDIAGRIALNKGGVSIVKKLIATSQKKAKEKEAAKGASPKAKFMKTERERLVASGLTDKKKIADELKRLWETSLQHQKKPSKTISKKTKLQTKVTEPRAVTTGDIVKSSKPLTDAVRKARNLSLIGSTNSSGKTEYMYIKDEEESGESDDDDELEERAVSRIKAKKIKREHINGVLEGFGVDASSWPLAHAKEEMIHQIMNETDNDDSDDEEEGDEEEEEGDEEEEEE